MRQLLLVTVILFIALPLDAQERLAGGVGLLVTHPYFPFVAAGGVGALVVTLALHTFIYNAAMYQLYLDDIARAKDTYQKRRK